MSTDRSRLVSSIRRIVLTDPDLSSALDAWQNRGDQASSAGVGTSDAARDRLCCDGSTSDNPNPGADTRDTSEGGQDGLDPDDPADIGDMGGGCLSGVTDCATGEDVCFCGDDWIPPEGWDDPTTPPIDPSYQEGTFWIVFNFNNSPSSGTADATASGSVEKQDAKITTSDFSLGSKIDDDTYRVCINGDCENDWRVRRQDCNGSSEDYCNPDEEDIIVESWPEDGCTNLAIKNGTIVGSKYDPENDGTYSKPMSEIELCDEFGNSFFLSPASNGGWKTIDSTETDGYLYDSQGNKIAHIDGNEYADPDV